MKKKNKLLREIIHYVVLTIFLFFFYYVGDFYFNITEQNIFFMFTYWLIALFISDKIIQKILEKI